MCMARLFPDKMVKKQKTWQYTKPKIKAVTKTKRSNIDNNKNKRMHGTCMARLFPDKMVTKTKNLAKYKTKNQSNNKNYEKQYQQSTTTKAKECMKPVWQGCSQTE